MKIQFKKRYDAPFQSDLMRIESCGPDICWALGSGQLIKTEDKGKSWKNVYKSPPLQTRTVPHRIAFHSAREGLLLVHRSPEIIYFRTENGGRDWFQVRRVAKGVWAEMCVLRRPARAWTLIKDGASSVEIADIEQGVWKRVAVPIPGQPRDIVFANDRSGWILERWNENSWIEGSPEVERTTTVLHRSTDGGDTWSIVAKMECSLSRLVAISAEKLFLAGEDGIYVSEDSGANWRHILSKPRVPLLDLHFLGNFGAAIGTEGLIESEKDILLMFSRDGGETWIEAPLPAVEAFFGIRMMTWTSGILASCSSIYTFDID